MVPDFQVQLIDPAHQPAALASESASARQDESAVVPGLRA